jgi:hypothetical protein
MQNGLFPFKIWGVATTFEQKKNHSHFGDQDPIMASLESVGWIEEILS